MVYKLQVQKNSQALTRKWLISATSGSLFGLSRQFPTLKESPPMESEWFPTISFFKGKPLKFSRLVELYCDTDFSFIMPRP